MKILVLTTYDDEAASSRERFLLYFDYLKKAGIEINWSPFITNHIFSGWRSGVPSKKIDLLMCFLKRMRILFTLKSYDVIWLQSEVFPRIPFWVEKLTGIYKKRVIVNYDDAIFHLYDSCASKYRRWLLSKKISNVMRAASVVVVGNSYLEQYAKNAKANNIVRMPTVVDTSVYFPRSVEKDRNDRPIKIGWLGSPSTQHHLSIVLPALKELFLEVNAELHLMGINRFFDSLGLDATVHFWTEKSQLEFLDSIDIGIMPLIDEPFARGKCGYKLIQYMAFNKPVVATPLEMNSEIIDDGLNGFFANSNAEWLQTLKKLCETPKLRIAMGSCGRRKVEKNYSVAATLPVLLNLLVSGKKNSGFDR